MKHKVSELEGALLDATVAKAEGIAFRLNEGKCLTMLRVQKFKTLAADCGTIKVPSGFDETLKVFCPSSDWSHGGPIIERERISLDPWIGGHGTWTAICAPSGVDYREVGPSPLIAAMRAYVASKFGEEVEL